MWYKNICIASFSFVTIHACDGRTDRRTELRLPRPPSHMLARQKLENVAVDDVLPRKAARRCAIANVTLILGPRDTSDLISMVAFTFAMQCHLIRLAFGPFTSFVGNFGWGQRSRTQNSRRMRENAGIILIRMWTKVHEILGQCSSPLVLSNTFARLSTSHFI